MCIKYCIQELQLVTNWRDTASDGRLDARQRGDQLCHHPQGVRHLCVPDENIRQVPSLQPTRTFVKSPRYYRRYPRYYRGDGVTFEKCCWTTAVAVVKTTGTEWGWGSTLLDGDRILDVAGMGMGTGFCPAGTGWGCG